MSGELLHDAFSFAQRGVRPRHPEHPRPREGLVLLNPGIEIPDEAAAVHGITTEHAREHGVDAAEGVAAILELLAACAHLPFVAFNATFDFTIMDREARRHGLEPFVPAIVIDPFVLDKQIDTYRSGGRTLAVVCEHYGVALDNAHSADADALAAVEVARAIGRLLKLDPDAAVVHGQTIGWKAEQAASFEKYLRTKKGKPDAVIVRAWPVVPFTGAAAA